MLQRKLCALDYPKYELLNFNDDKTAKKIIIWVEENFIKKCKPEQYASLRNIDAPQWAQVYEQYKQDISCPITTGNITDELEWILGSCIIEKYKNNKNKYIQGSEDSQKVSTTPAIIADNPLDHLDFSSPEFESNVKTLASIMKVFPHPNPNITLSAIRKVSIERLSQYAVEHPEEFIIKGTPFPFQEADLGFDLGDPVLNRAAKILRLLYIHNLRELQTVANELIVAVQSVTADPKTDTKLGKVGR